MYTYANKETVENILKSYEDKSIDELIDVIKKYHKLLISNKEQKKTCTSDFCYWGLVSVGEEYEMILEVLERKVYDSKIEELKKICPSIFRENYKDKFEDSEQKYKSLIDKSKKIKNDLLIYKPHSYKAKIELIDMIFKEEKIK